MIQLAKHSDLMVLDIYGMLMALLGHNLKQKIDTSGKNTLA
jgi:hypothetical protein